jgi:serine/threonine protein kinase
MIDLKSKMKYTLINQVIREIQIFEKIDHPNVLKLKEKLFSEKKRIVYLVMEFASFGSLGRILEMK